MVVNGCLLDEAYGESLYVKQKKKKNKNKMKHENVEIDNLFNKSSNVIQASDNGENHYPITEKYYSDNKENNNKEYNREIVKEDPQKLKLSGDLVNDNQRVTEYNQMISNKDYQEYLEFQRNRHKYIHSKNIIESFSNINDNFNDVLLFGLFGVFFLIFTDYIYKLGKRSY